MKAARIRRGRPLGGPGAPLLVVDDLAVATAASRRSKGVSLEVRRRDRGDDRRERRRQDDRRSRRSSASCPIARRPRPLRRQRPRVASRHGAAGRAPASPLVPEGRAHLRGPRPSARTSSSARGATSTRPTMAETVDDDGDALPRLGERMQPARRHALRRRAADARDRPRHDGAAPPCCSSTSPRSASRRGSSPTSSRPIAQIASVRHHRPPRRAEHPTRAQVLDARLRAPYRADRRRGGDSKDLAANEWRSARPTSAADPRRPRVDACRRATIPGRQVADHPIAAGSPRIAADHSRITESDRREALGFLARINASRGALRRD